MSDPAIIHNLKPYPAYKNSGVEWLGQVPEGWEVERGKSLFTKVERPVRDIDEVVTCFRDGTVTLRRNRRTRGFTESLKEIGYQGIRAGDLIIHAMDAFAGAVGVADSDGKGSPVYAVCIPKGNAIPQYHALAIREMARTQWILALSTGIRERSTDFRFATFAGQRLPSPPLAEQAAIVRYLNHVDRKVKRFVRAKRKLIALLEEQKRAIIHQAVTRGLDPNVPMKDSGVEWLGEVPEGWEVVPLRYLATKFGSGVTPRGGASVYTREGVPFLRSQNVHFSGLRLDGVARIAPALHHILSNTHVRSGDVLLNITGASIGRVCFVPEHFDEGNVNQHVCIIRVRQQALSPEYLSLFLSTPGMQREIRFEQNGASREGLTLDAIRSLKIALPSMTEQIDIANHILYSTSHIDSTITRTQREISLIEEYRTRLISDVVTGKLDVREAAAALPEEVEGEEPEEIETDEGGEVEEETDQLLEEDV